MTMPKLACMTLPYAAHSFERALEGIARAGYRYAAFGTPHRDEPVCDVDDEGSVEQVRNLLSRYELVPVMLLAHAQFHHTEPLEGAIKQLRFAKALEIPEVNALGFWGYHHFPDRPLSPEEYDESNRRFVSYFKDVAEEAERLGITVSLKPHTGNTATPGRLRDTLDLIASPRMKACYDPGNVSYYEGLDPVQDFERVVNQLVSFVAKDHKRGLRHYDFPIPGDGDVPFLDMFKQMREAGCQGPILVEKLDGNGDLLPPEEIDRRVAKAKVNLELLLDDAGYQ